ncbi:MAG: endonuclease/exonuclease/phosphatase family protein [Flavobacteriaceae bacterium]|nr:endonuclease/exonuclease/phosphatase family protein [Flavobacteriaceae bacterium]
MKIKFLLNNLFVLLVLFSTYSYGQTVKDKSAYPYIRLATYNIQIGENAGTDALIEAIRDMNVDIISLQEVDNMTKRSAKYNATKKPINQAKYMADKLGMHYYFGEATNVTKGGTYGTAILSKYPLKLKKRVVLPNEKGETPKVCYGIEVQVPNYPQPVVAITAHLYWVAGKLLDKQIETLRLGFGRWALRDGLPVIMGDLNIVPKSREYKRMTLIWNDTDKQGKYTGPAWDPDRKLDYILTSTAQKWDVKSVWVPKPNDKTSKGVKYSQLSDHLPLVVEMKLIEE